MFIIHCYNKNCSGKKFEFDEKANSKVEIVPAELGEPNIATIELICPHCGFINLLLVKKKNKKVFEADDINEKTIIRDWQIGIHELIRKEIESYPFKESLKPLIISENIYKTYRPHEMEHEFGKSSPRIYTVSAYGGYL